MTAWVISISNDYADHWDIAAEHGGWDLRRNARIQPGDDVFFRISQGNLAGWTRATSPTTPTDDAPIIPWRNRLTGGYTHRFTFDVVSTTVTAASTWADIKAATGTSEVPNKPVRFDDLDQQEALQGTVAVGPRVDVAAPLVDVKVAYDHRDTDERQRALRRQSAQKASGCMPLGFDHGGRSTLLIDDALSGLAQPVERTREAGAFRGANPIAGRHFPPDLGCREYIPHRLSCRGRGEPEAGRTDHQRF